MTIKLEVPFFDYPALYAQHKVEYMSILQEVLERGAYIMQKDLTEFEENLAEYLGVKHAIGVADGTMALLLALKSLGIGRGDEVIVSSHTFVASAAAIHHAGATPVLADCGSDHLIDPMSIAKNVTSRTKAIMPVQLNGRTANMDAIQEIADQNDLLIVEDSCQALGSKYKGKYAGTFGAAGTFSFFPAKTLGCFGDGGALVTNDDAVAREVLLLRDHGRSDTGEIVRWGFNSRLDNIQAAILKFKLQFYDDEVARRREIAALYDANLRDIPQLKLPPSPEENLDHFDVYQNYEIEADDRDNLQRYLKDRGIGTILQWGGMVVHQFSKLDVVNRDLPVTEKLTKSFLMLPLNTVLENEAVEYVCENIRKFYNS